MKDGGAERGGGRPAGGGGYALRASPAAGRVLTVAASLGFFALCMALPLVGKAGTATPFRAANRLPFALVALTAFALAALAAGAGALRRRRGGGPVPWFPLGLLACCAFVLLAFAAGWLGL